MFGLFEKKKVPISADDMIKLMPADKSYFEGLIFDEDIPRDLYRVAGVQVTVQRKSMQRKLVRCRDAVKSLVAQLKKNQAIVYYIAPEWFELELKDLDGSRVRCNARFNVTPETSAGLVDWLELNVRTPGVGISVKEVAALLSGKPKPDWLEVKDAVEISGPNPDEEVDNEPESSHPTVESLDVGSKLFNRWEIIKELGEGGMGKVYLANDLMTRLEENRKVVVKVMHIETAHDPYAIEQFVKEATILKGLRHKYIASLEDCLQLDDGTPIIIMEYVEGMSMYEYISRRGGALDEKMTRELLLPMAQALDYAHSEKIYHLDVKPQNIMVRKSMKSGARTCLLDFGIAKKAHSDGSMTFTMSVAGTPLYMSQEQRNGEPANAAMDVYALAVTAYECLMGEMPYPRGQTMSYSVRPIPSDTPFAKAIMRGLDINPANRPKSCEELINPPSVARQPNKGSVGVNAQGTNVAAVKDGGRKDTPVTPRPPVKESLSGMVKTFNDYRMMLAQSANRTMRSNPEIAEWMRGRQAALRDMTKDLAAANPEDLIVFFSDIRAKLSELSMSPEDLFVAVDRLNELRCGLPKEGGRVWQAVCESVR